MILQVLYVCPGPWRRTRNLFWASIRMIIISNHLFIWQGKKPDLAIPLFVNFSRVSNVYNLNFPGIIKKGYILSKLSYARAGLCSMLAFVHFLYEWQFPGRGMCQTFGGCGELSCSEWFMMDNQAHRSATAAAKPKIRNRTVPLSPVSARKKKDLYSLSSGQMLLARLWS